MLTFIFIILGLGFCFFVTFMFSLAKAGRRADIGEEKILAIISPSITNAVKPGNRVEAKYHFRRVSGIRI